MEFNNKLKPLKTQRDLLLESAIRNIRPKEANRGFGYMDYIESAKDTYRKAIDDFLLSKKPINNSQTWKLVAEFEAENGTLADFVEEILNRRPQ